MPLNSTNIYLLAGEASGDLHGANLVRALGQLRPTWQYRAFGGAQLAAAGASISVDNRTTDYFGFVEVVRHLPSILGLFKRIKADILAHRPAALVCIDYPGFNLRMARWAHAQGIPVVYYILPQVWAWKPGRLAQLRDYVGLRLPILPFEVEFYRSRRVSTTFPGHPLLDALAPVLATPNTLPAELGLPEGGYLAVLPGSRKNEVARMLPVLLEAARPLLDRYPAVIAQAPQRQAADFAPILAQLGLSAQQVRLVQHRTYDVVRGARAALVCSGTATLETALLGTPQLLGYRVNALSYRIARALIKGIDYIGLPNLILGRMAVREYIQAACTPQALRTELEALVDDGARREAQLADYAALRAALGGPGASERAAEAIVRFLERA